jgi:hypothetical protein
MGHWDYHAIALRDDECAQHVAYAVSQVYGFHVNGEFTWNTQRWLHVGWTEANQLSYVALTAFCMATGRCWITSYTRDTRATLDARFFTTDVQVRAQRLRAVFGPPPSDLLE